MKTKKSKINNNNITKLLGYINFRMNHKKIDEISGSISVFANNRQTDQWLVGLVEDAKKGIYAKDFTILGEAMYNKPKNKKVSYGYFMITVMDNDGNMFNVSKSILKNPKMANDVKLLKWFKANKKAIKKAVNLDIEMYPVGILSKKQLKAKRGNFV